MLATEGYPECERCGGPVYDEETHAKACGQSPFDADTCPDVRGVLRAVSRPP